MNSVFSFPSHPISEPPSESNCFLSSPFTCLMLSIRSGLFVHSDPRKHSISKQVFIHFFHLLARTMYLPVAADKQPAICTHPCPSTTTILLTTGKPKRTSEKIHRTTTTRKVEETIQKSGKKGGKKKSEKNRKSRYCHSGEASPE